MLRSVWISGSFVARKLRARGRPRLSKSSAARTSGHCFDYRRASLFLRLGELDRDDVRVVHLLCDEVIDFIGAQLSNQQECAVAVVLGEALQFGAVAEQLAHFVK